MLPYLNKYKSRIKGAEAAITLKSKRQTLLGQRGGSSIFAKKYNRRAEDILNARLEKARKVLETNEERIQKEKDASLESFVTSELGKQKDAYTKRYDAGGSYDYIKNKSMTMDQINASKNAIIFKDKKGTLLST